MSFRDQQIQLDVFNPRSTSIIEPILATVNDEIEFNNLPSNLINVKIDLSDNSILLNFTDAGTSNFSTSNFNGYVLSDVGENLPIITNVSINDSETTLDLNKSDITFTEDRIEINVEELSFTPETTALLDVEFGELETTGFLGDRIELEIFNPREQPISNKMVATVNNSFEFTQLPDNEINGSTLVNVNLNLSADSILLEFTDAGTGNFDSSNFNGYVFSDIDESLPPITNVTIDDSQTTLGLDNSDITFTEDRIEINVEGLSYNPETTALLDVEFGETDNTIELFRFRNTSFDTGTYVFVGESERDNILASENLSGTFSLDGREDENTINPAFKASTVSGEYLIPFYRLKSLDLPGTFLFVSTSEYNAIFDVDSEQKDKWEKEGLDEEENDIPEFYLLDGSADRGVGFNRFQNTANGTFLYAGPAETEAIESNPNLSSLFTNQGVAFESL